MIVVSTLELIYDAQKLNEQLPELIDGRNFKTLVGRVYATQRGTERHHLQVGVLLEEESALQTCMYGAYLGLCGK